MGTSSSYRSLDSVVKAFVSELVLLFVVFNDLSCRLPADILIKVLSYLDAAALFTISHVSKHLHQFASDK